MITITSGPSGTSNSATASFAFGASEGGVSFECQLDGSGFSSCSSPKVYGSLSSGAHTFQVRGTDLAGLASAQSATRSWNYNPAATSNTTSGAVPAGGVVGTDPTNSGPTAQDPTTASISLPNGGQVEIVQEPASGQPPAGFSVVGQQFRITAPDATVSEPLVLEFRLDSSAIPSGASISELTLLRNGLAAADCTDQSGNAVPDPCVASREQLPDGDVVIKVLTSRASTWAAVAGTNPPDSTPPDTTIDSGPSGTIATDQATFTFSGNPASDTAKVQCRIDSGAFADCTSPKTFTGLADGPHTATFRAEDAAGNQDATPATRTFTVDTSVDPPVVDPPVVDPPIDPPVVDPPVVDPPDGKAKIGKVKVGGPAKIKKGKKATYKLKIKNSGGADATGVKIKVKGKGVKAKKKVGKIAAGKTKTIKVKLKFKKPGKVKTTFKVTSENAGGKTVRKKFTVKS